MKRVLTMIVVLALVASVPVGFSADFNGDGTNDIGIFRPSTGLWAIRDGARVYFGGIGDEPMPGDYDGDGTVDIAIFRPSTGLWAVDGGLRAYFGGSGDVPLPGILARGGSGGQALYDYIVTPGDGADLVQALESDTYLSVFIPVGTYNVSEVIDIDHVRRIIGEEMYDTRINFQAGTNHHLNITVDYCHIENISTYLGGNSAYPYDGVFHITGKYVKIRECRSYAAEGSGFSFTSAADYLSLTDCIAQSARNGFTGPEPASEPSSRLVNCSARTCSGFGFSYCSNLSNCYVYGGGSTDKGFNICGNLSTCYSIDCIYEGFNFCQNLSSCVADGAEDGFFGCSNVAACHARNFDDIAYNGCLNVVGSSP
jgi:hypothetical protein